MILKHNHRQGKSKEWAETLNRIREGILNAKDEAILRERITDQTFLEEESGKKPRNIWFLNKTRFILGFTNITSLKNGDDYLCFLWSMSDMALMKEMSPMTT